MVRYCTECGSKLNDDFTFCTECGTKVFRSSYNVPVKEEIKKDKDRKCHYCGNKIELIIPYKCKGCGEYFCNEHRLPEQHNCTAIKSSWDSWKQQQEKYYKTPEIRKSHTPVHVKSTSKTHKSKSYRHKSKYHRKKRPYRRKSRPRRPYRRSIGDTIIDGLKVIGAIIIIIGVILFFIGYSLGFEVLFGFFSTVAGNYQNPTYQEMVEFIHQDTTDGNQYTVVYVCDNFAKDVIHNARDKGMRAGYVLLEEPYGSGHAIVCFETKDRGMYFLEPQLDYIFPKSELEDMVNRGIYDVDVCWGGYYGGGEYFYMKLSGYSIDWYKYTG